MGQSNSLSSVISVEINITGMATGEKSVRIYS